MRGFDNWLNSFDYIKNQLLIYDYNNINHFHILKMKFWILDDSIKNEENLIDNDVKNPLNHRESLKNELVFLDKYIRTKDKKLIKDEENYHSFCRNRKSQLRDFISRKKPNSNIRYQDWEQDYSSRPSLLIDSQFDQLYYIYKRKEKSGELLSAFDILDKIDDITIDNRTYMQESSILLYIEPSIQEQTIRNSAIKEKQKEDIHFVWEMNRAHEEIIFQILEIKPDIEKEIEKIEGPKDDTPLNPGDPPKIIKTISDASIVICNFPTIRDNVGESKNDPTHRGMIIEQLGTGGYRFSTKDGKDLKTYFKLPDELLNIDESNNSENLTYINEMNIFLEGEVEWDFNDWEYGMFCTITETTQQAPSENPEPTRNVRNIESTVPPEPIPPKVSINLLKLNINKSSLTNIDRFNVLCKRWINLNELRERQMMLTGTRVQLESMFNATVPYMKDQMIKVFNDRKEEKINITNILKDFCLFGEFK